MLVAAAFHLAYSNTFGAGFNRCVNLNRGEVVEAIVQIQRKAGYGTDVQQQEQYSRRFF
jgi:hypothetical protein